MTRHSVLAHHTAAQNSQCISVHCGAGLSNVGFNVGIGNIGSAMSIFGFVFFIQPIMMAMMQEMPVRPEAPPLSEGRRA